MTIFSAELYALSLLLFYNFVYPFYYKSGRPLIITTNLTLEELNYPTDVQHKRIYDRVLGMCVPVKFIGVNFRKQEATTKMSTAKRLFGMEDK